MSCWGKDDKSRTQANLPLYVVFPEKKKQQEEQNSDYVVKALGRQDRNSNNCHAALGHVA